MADLEKDVIAGIGDKEAEENVIYPYFDATVRKFINGISESIIDGLVLSRDGLTLTAGLCLAEGFIGELKDDITFDTAPNKIYGQFVINHTKGVVDRFYIKADPVESLIKRDDILHYKGEYWILLYENKELQCNDDYPAHAVLADNATYLMPYSNTMPTIGANVEVEGVMKSSDTNDKTVATTEWVQNLLQEEINTGKVELPFGVSQTDIATDDTANVGTVTFVRKAKIVIGTIKIREGNILPEATVAFSQKLPAGFLPKQNVYFVIVYATGTPNTRRVHNFFEIATDGTIKRLYTKIDADTTELNKPVYSPFTLGYEVE